MITEKELITIIYEIRKKSLLSSFGLIIKEDDLRDILKKYLEKEK